MRITINKEVMLGIPYRLYAEMCNKYPRIEERKYSKKNGDLAIRSALMTFMINEFANELTGLYSSVHISSIFGKDHATGLHHRDGHKHVFNKLQSDYNILYTHWYSFFSNYYRESPLKKEYEGYARSFNKHEFSRYGASKYGTRIGHSG